MSEFMLAIMRMNDDELLEYLISKAEGRAVYVNSRSRITEDDWHVIDHYTTEIESIKSELKRRM